MAHCRPASLRSSRGGPQSSYDWISDVVRNTDWIIDLGPEGGSRGGRVMFEGTPADLKHARQSITSQYI